MCQNQNKRQNMANGKSYFHQNFWKVIFSLCKSRTQPCWYTVKRGQGKFCCISVAVLPPPPPGLRGVGIPFRALRWPPRTSWMCTKHTQCRDLVGVVRWYNYILYYAQKHIVTLRDVHGPISSINAAMTFGWSYFLRKWCYCGGIWIVPYPQKILWRDSRQGIFWVAAQQIPSQFKNIPGAVNFSEDIYMREKSTWRKCPAPTFLWRHFI